MATEEKVVVRRRPQAVVEAEYQVTQRALDATKAACDTLLKIRHSLMEDGFPAGHALCENLDASAASWAAQLEGIRRQLQALKVEGGF
jgi:hypothetical protein